MSLPEADYVQPFYNTKGQVERVSTTRETVAYTYSPTTRQLSSASWPSQASLGYEYDGSLPKTVTWSGALSGSVSRTYDSFFRPYTETYGGASVTYGYDDDGLLTAAGALTVSRSPTTGFISGSTLGSATEARTYNDYGEEQTYAASFGAMPLYSVNYGTRDALGRIVHKDESVGAAAHGYDYAYDAMGRLTDVKVDGVQRPSGAPAWSSAATYAQGACVTYAAQKYCSQTSGNQGNTPDASASWAVAPLYAYGPNGNRIAAPGLTSAPVYDDQDRLLSYGHFSYTYKGDGSLRTKSSDVEPVQTTTYDYDAFGNLRNVKLPDGGHVEYVIDAQNRRVGKKVCTTAIDVPCPGSSLVEGFLYRSQLQPVVWLNGDGSVKARFVYGGKPNVPEYMVTAAGATYRLITDQVGSVRLVVDVASGAVAQAIDYDEFGNILTDSAPGTQPFGFAGGLYDSLTGLTRFGARDYDPAVGRWPAKDSLGFGGGLSDLYSYVGSDPVGRTDASGLAWGDVIIKQLRPPRVIPPGFPVTGCENHPNTMGCTKWSPGKGTHACTPRPGGFGFDAVVQMAYEQEFVVEPYGPARDKQNRCAADHEDAHVDDARYWFNSKRLSFWYPTEGFSSMEACEAARAGVGRFVADQFDGFRAYTRGQDL